jgi:hypothetical protein
MTAWRAGFDSVSGVSRGIEVAQEVLGQRIAARAACVAAGRPHALSVRPNARGNRGRRLTSGDGLPDGDTPGLLRRLE